MAMKQSAGDTTVRKPDEQVGTFDVVAVGAGFAGMYLIHRMRNLGFTVRVLEAGDGVGGTWYWNRYPGARCDVQSIDYSYSFDPDLEHEWTWSEKYATQPEILRYANHVADKHDLRRDITFGTRVVSAQWDDHTQRWHVHTADGDRYTSRFYVMATGCLSVPKEVDIEGADSFAGPTYVTGRWPHDDVDFSGQRVVVIGTGSSAIQSIPHIAAQAAQLTVFQRTANFSIPANNGPVPAAKQAAHDADPAAFRHEARWSGAGVAVERSMVSALTVSDDERLATYEAAWERGGIVEFLATYGDHLVSPVANRLLSEFVHSKIKAIVHDPQVAEMLCPTAFPIGTKRLCVDSNYYETFNRPNVRLVDLRRTPITRIDERGVQMADEHVDADAIVFATGFDAMTGAIVNVDIEGRGGRSLREAWAHGPVTYMGLMTNEFPNLFMVTGPGSPSVLANMMVAIEQHIDAVADTLAHLRENGFDTIEPTPAAVDGWVQHANDWANITLFPQANSWYMGANVPGKPQVFLPFCGGVDRYRRAWNDAVAADYLGFTRRGPNGAVTNDGVVRELQPDVELMLEMLAEMGLPTLDTMSPTDARMFSDALSAARPPGPDVGEVVDGEFPGAEGPLRYRAYRPVGATAALPLIVYFHGGGWVLGSADSDDPFCRDLCVRTGAVVVSCDYRHAPEAVFPAAVDDAWAALRWAAEHAAELGGDAQRLGVAGWSAGANLAAVVCHLARDAAGPAVRAQMLLTPVTDGTLSSGSHQSNGEGFILTRALMRWFFDHYVPPEQRTDPRVAPLHAPRLDGLPPAVVVTCQFDPLRDEGDAYAAALSEAGVAVRHIRARGHIHTSITAVDALPSGAVIRAELGDALKDLL